MSLRETRNVLAGKAKTKHDWAGVLVSHERAKMGEEGTKSVTGEVSVDVL